MIMHARVGLKIHFAQDLREFEKSLCQQEEKHFAAFPSLCEIRKRPLRLFHQGGDRLGAFVFLVACFGFRELRPRNRIIGNRIAHELRKAVRLDAAVGVYGQAMAVNLDSVPVDQDVSLNQRKMNVKRFGVSRQRGRKVSVSYIRQTVPLSTQLIDHA
ncbi:hypothetical protein SPHV1_2170047 [Novosphingobium sp. KN65.2]|nr:hypothetical protein SPHV1_2170047 [Novosphingobium sp. KN65.2]